MTAGEKFRRIMEAYLVELDFGRTIEAYRGELNLDNAVKTVNFLRVGRLGLVLPDLGRRRERMVECRKGCVSRVLEVTRAKKFALD